MAIDQFHTAVSVYAAVVVTLAAAVAADFLLRSAGRHAASGQRQSSQYGHELLASRLGHGHGSPHGA
ncbi:hypothetical protein RA210_U250023 [Rubrivivax sp. A210]|nr:hypothetical protein RA210_U250023 [Rubrivivax sp. A210]